VTGNEVGRKQQGAQSSERRSHHSCPAKVIAKTACQSHSNSLLSAGEAANRLSLPHQACCCEFRTPSDERPIYRECQLVGLAISRVIGSGRGAAEDAQQAQEEVHLLRKNEGLGDRPRKLLVSAKEICNMQHWGVKASRRCGPSLQTATRSCHESQNLGQRLKPKLPVLEDRKWFPTGRDASDHHFNVFGLSQRKRDSGHEWICQLLSHGHCRTRHNLVVPKETPAAGTCPSLGLPGG
jgi:hypothetical protein